MIYITGDTHGNFDRVVAFCKKMNTTKEDILIVLGDAGINYFGGKKDIILKNILANLPITLFCIHGNHEMRPQNIEGYKLIDYKGGKVWVQDEYPNILFAKDGEIFEFKIGEFLYKTIVIGGAYSVDKFYRKMRGFSWFPDEQPSEEIKDFVEEQLENESWDVDIVLSHTCPFKYEPREWFLPFLPQFTVDKTTELWLDKIEESLKYKKWYCGHYHGSKKIDKLQFMFEDFDELRVYD